MNKTIAELIVLLKSKNVRSTEDGIAACNHYFSSGWSLEHDEWNSKMTVDEKTLFVSKLLKLI